MAGNAFLAGTQTVALAGAVSNPASVQIPDSTATMAAFHRNGSLIEDSLHGQYYAAASRGNLFMASTALAGVTVPAPATTLASKAGMINPLGSNRIVELVGISLGGVTVDVALKDFFMEFQINATTTGGAATSVTKLTSYSQPLSVGTMASQAYAYTAATMTNAAANPIVLPLFGHADTAVGWRPTYFPINGMILMGPDTVMAITVNTTAIAAVQISYHWAEWLP
jgi:hypothetical protein